MLGNIGTAELFIIMLVILLVFGAKRIPEIARGLGKGIREFKEATREISNELRLGDDRRGPTRSDIAPPNTPRRVGPASDISPDALPRGTDVSAHQQERTESDVH